MPTDSAERWQNRVNSLKEGVLKLYETKDFSDVVFRVGRKHFKAHKLVLAARCSEFSRMLLDPHAVDDIIIEEDAVTETGFEILMRFIYTDSLGTDDKQSIVQAFLAADFYKQNKLKEKCEEHIESWSISVDEVCELLNVSLDIVKLKEKCLEFIKNNAFEVISSPNFFKLNYRALVSILENDVLRDVEIKARIVKIVEWGAQNHTTPVDYALVRDDFLNQSPPILGMLRIEELDLNELTKIFAVDYHGLLTPDEVMNFIKYFQVKDNAFLPAWCTRT